MASTRKARFKARAYPTPQQEEWVKRHLGATRATYNSYLYERGEAFKRGESKPAFVLSNFKTLPKGYEWVKEHSQAILDQAKRDAEKAYANWFSSMKGTRKGPKVQRPRFKKKREAGSFSWCAGTQVKRLSEKWGAVRLPKGPKGQEWLKFRWTREIPKNPGTVTLKLSPNGWYEVSFTVEQEIAPQKTEGPKAAADGGLSDLLAVTSTEGIRYKVANPRWLKKEQRALKRAQRAYSRTAPGSANREKARKRVAKIHGKIARARLDFHRKVAFRLASENQAVALETLAVAAMSRNRRLSKSFADAGLGGLLAAVENACERLGTLLVKVPRNYPSTRLCAPCGYGSEKKELSVRDWVCPACGAHLDRDYNAAVNLLLYLLAGGHPESLNARGGERLASLAAA